MRLAFCLYKYFPFGGLERNFVAVANECIKRGHIIDGFSMEWQGEVPVGIKAHRVPVKGLSNHKRVASFVSWISSNLARDDYDLVIGFNKMPLLDLYYAADVCYVERVRHQRGKWARFTPRYRIFSRLEESVFGRSSDTHIVYISNKEKAIYQAVYGTPEDRFHYAPPGVNKALIRQVINKDCRDKIRKELGLSPDDIFLLMVGSNFATKGVDRSIKALASLPDNLRSVTHLVVVGKGKEKRFRRLAVRLGVNEKVHFMGGRDDVPRFLAGADFLLQPSVNENTGNAIVEALVAGLPVLTTENCGFAEHVSNAKAGVVVPASPFDQNVMNKMLADMLLSGSKDLWRQNALLYSDTYDLYNRISVIADLIEEIASN